MDTNNTAKLVIKGTPIWIHYEDEERSTDTYRLSTISEIQFVENNEVMCVFKGRCIEWEEDEDLLEDDELENVIFEGQFGEPEIRFTVGTEEVEFVYDIPNNDIEESLLNVPFYMPYTKLFNTRIILNSCIEWCTFENKKVKTTPLYAKYSFPSINSNGECFWGKEKVFRSFES